MVVNDVFTIGVDIADNGLPSGEIITSDPIIDRLDTIIEGQQALFNALWLIIGIIVIGIVFKISWTFIAKWIFGGV